MYKKLKKVYASSTKKGLRKKIPKSEKNLKWGTKFLIPKLKKRTIKPMWNNFLKTTFLNYFEMPNLKNFYKFTFFAVFQNVSKKKIFSKLSPFIFACFLEILDSKSTFSFFFTFRIFGFFFGNAKLNYLKFFAVFCHGRKKLHCQKLRVFSTPAKPWHLPKETGQNLNYFIYSNNYPAKTEIKKFFRIISIKMYAENFHRNCDRNRFVKNGIWFLTKKN